MASPAIIVIQKRQPQLEKAKLVAYNSEAPEGAMLRSEVLKPRTEIGISGCLGAARRRHRNEINLVLLRIWRCS